MQWILNLRWSCKHNHYSYEYRDLIVVSVNRPTLPGVMWLPWVQYTGHKLHSMQVLFPRGWIFFSHQASTLTTVAKQYHYTGILHGWCTWYLDCSMKERATLKYKLPIGYHFVISLMNKHKKCKPRCIEKILSSYTFQHHQETSQKDVGLAVVNKLQKQVWIIFCSTMYTVLQTIPT